MIDSSRINGAKNGFRVGASGRLLRPPPPPPPGAVVPVVCRARPRRSLPGIGRETLFKSSPSIHPVEPPTFPVSLFHPYSAHRPSAATEACLVVLRLHFTLLRTSPRDDPLRVLLATGNAATSNWTWPPSHPPALPLCLIFLLFPTILPPPSAPPHPVPLLRQLLLTFSPLFGASPSVGGGRWRRAAGQGPSLCSLATGGG